MFSEWISTNPIYSSNDLSFIFNEIFTLVEARSNNLKRIFSFTANVVDWKRKHRLNVTLVHLAAVGIEQKKLNAIKMWKNEKVNLLLGKNFNSYFPILISETFAAIDSG